MTPRQAISSEWADLLTEGPISLGYDIATTERGTSNPSGITVLQKEGMVNISRLIVTWKTAEPAVARQLISCILDDIAARDRKARRLVIDASSEKYYAADIRTAFSRRVAVELVGGNQKLSFRGEEMDAKTLLGNMYSAAMEDGFILLPTGAWIELDLRLVKREGGRFITDLGKGGEHGEVFDSGKLAYWGLHSGSGKVSAKAISVGGISSKKASRPGIIGSIAKHLGRRSGSHISS
jgi:hypothetical protein